MASQSNYYYASENSDFMPAPERTQGLILNSTVLMINSTTYSIGQIY